MLCFDAGDTCRIQATHLACAHATRLLPESGRRNGDGGSSGQEK
jgi:hypothetical protein